MNTGIISNVKRSQSGKPLGVLIGDRWYQTKNWALEHAIGRTIEFEVTTSEFNGKSFYWLDKERLVDGVPGAATAPARAAAAKTSVAAPENMAFMPFVSNTVAHAIASGYCKTPEQIYSWAYKAFNVAKALVSGTAPDLAPESDDNKDFDDDIPF